MIIGLSGKAGSGKDTIADYLVTKGFKKLSFGSPVKDITAIITNWNRDLVEGSTKESREFRENVKHPIYGLTCRELMQVIGHDLFREKFSEDIWINILLDKIIEGEGHNYVISDVRYDNEAQALLFKHALLINVKRHDQSGKKNKHASESSLTIPAKYIIQNDGTIEDLYTSIDSIINKK